MLVWRLRRELHGANDEERLQRTERRAERLVRLSFLMLAAYVTYEAAETLLRQEAPDPSPVGIALTALSIAVMLWLARAKRQTDEALGSRALIAGSMHTLRMLVSLRRRSVRSRPKPAVRFVVGRSGDGARYRGPAAARGHRSRAWRRRGLARTSNELIPARCASSRSRARLGAARAGKMVVLVPRGPEQGAGVFRVLGFAAARIGDVRRAAQ